ncbi:MAG: hypothetical protein IKR70_02660 [Lachnospiraceae bacterium]|nr:hypothetical protein [Lachnospiraceae bacterium]
MGRDKKERGIELGKIKRAWERIKNSLERIQKQNEEIIYTKVWEDTIRDIDWIKALPGISPGRWAVGYNYLYVMTRILNEKNPKSVLDLGLGISSTLISSYFEGKGLKDGRHDVIENNPDWAEFYDKNKRISDITKINIVECVKKQYNGVEYNAYLDIKDIVGNNKYDVISIDAPLGATKYARRDILDYIPDILNKSFAIVIDDTEREGEINTIKEIKQKLEKSGIKYSEGIYFGMSNVTVIASEDNKYLCSM